MNDHEPPSPGARTEEEPYARLDMLAVTSDDPSVLNRWQLAIGQWGYAFVAFTRLRLPELFTLELAETFESLYAGSYADLVEAAIAQIDGLGWNDALHRLRRVEAIAEELLVWNYPAFIDQLSQVYEFIYAGRRVHLFAK